VCVCVCVNFYMNYTGIIHTSKFYFHIISELTYPIILGTLYHLSFTQQNSIY